MRLRDLRTPGLDFWRGMPVTIFLYQQAHCVFMRWFCARRRPTRLEPPSADTVTDKPLLATVVSPRWFRFAAYKSPRIKLITSMVEAIWMVRQTVGKPFPALIGLPLS